MILDATEAKTERENPPPFFGEIIELGEAKNGKSSWLDAETHRPTTMASAWVGISALRRLIRVVPRSPRDDENRAKQKAAVRSRLIAATSFRTLRSTYCSRVGLDRQGYARERIT